MLPHGALSMPTCSLLAARTRPFVLLHSGLRHGAPCSGLRHAAWRQRSTVVFAQRQTETDEKPSWPGSDKASTQQEEQGESWGLFDGKAYLQPFEVPWGGKELAVGMFGWGVSFILVGLAFIPIAAVWAGPQGFSGLSQTDKAYFALANQVAETAVGVWVIRAAVSGFNPLPPGTLSIDFRDGFKKPTGWAVWAGLGVTLAPLVVFVSSVIFDEVLGYDGVSGRGTVDTVSQIISMDGSTFASLFATTAILAPILEETVFRGFLLASLTKWVPVPVALLLSSLAFGLVHFTPKDFPQLTALGMLLGLTYVRSRNLLAPMIIHGTWNGTVLSILYMLTSMGVDIDKLIHSY